MRVWLAVILMGCGGKAIPIVVLDGPRLAECPESPNCVSSQEESSDEEHYIEPFALRDDGPGIAELAAWMGERKRCDVLDQGDEWLHATCKTALFRFTDDIALLIDEDEGVVHVRSASRVGRSDMGKNRSRIETLRDEYAEL